MVSTTTRDGWFVSSRLGPGLDSIELSVRKPAGRGRYHYGDGHGRVFADLSELHAFAIERGYLQRWVWPEPAVFRATHRWELRRLHCRAVRAIQDGQDVLNVAIAHNRELQALGATAVVRTKFCNGLFAMERAARAGHRVH